MRFICLPKPVPSVLENRNNSYSDTVDILASFVEKPDQALSQESSDKKKRRAKQVISAKREDGLIN